MPVRYICSKCGGLLYRVDDPKEFLLSPSGVAALYNNKCPICGADLSKTRRSIKIQPNKSLKEKRDKDVKIIVDRREERTVIVTIRIPVWMNREVEYLINKYNYTSKNAFIRSAILNYIKKLHEKEEKQ